MAFGLENYIANAYIRSLVVILIVFVFLRMFLIIIEKVLLKVTSKTKTQADDILIKKSSKPLSLIIILLGLRLAIEELSLDSSIEEFMGKVIFSIIVLFVSYLAYLIMDIIIFRALKKMAKSNYESVKDLMSLAKSFLRIVIGILALLYVLELWGIEIGPFLAGLGIAGIAIAFAMQSTLSNIFGGISMILDKTVKAGDLVYLEGGTKGKIMNIGLRSTKILTFDNELIIVPNGKLADSKIQNVALPEPRSRVVIPFGVAYGSNISKVKKIVKSELKKINNLEKDSEIIVRFLEMSDSSLNFKAYFYVDSFEHRIDAVDEANTRIYESFNRNGIEIPFPQRDVHMKE